MSTKTEVSTKTVVSTNDESRKLASVKKSDVSELEVSELEVQVREFLDYLLLDTGQELVGVLPVVRKGKKWEKIREKLEDSMKTALQTPEVPNDYDPIKSYEEECVSAPFTGRFQALKLNSSSTIKDVKLNLLIVNAILTENKSASKKGFVNSPDLLTNPFLKVLGKCSVYFLKASNARVLPNSELSY